MNIHTSARLHEFRGSIALNVGGQETIYITPELAASLSFELQTASIQVKNGFHYLTTEVTE